MLESQKGFFSSSISDGRCETQISSNIRVHLDLHSLVFATWSKWSCIFLAKHEHLMKTILWCWLWSWTVKDTYLFGQVLGGIQLLISPSARWTSKAEYQKGTIPVNKYLKNSRGPSITVCERLFVGPHFSGPDILSSDFEPTKQVAASPKEQIDLRS